MYTDWNICATLKPEYIEYVKYFVQHHDWMEPVPDFVMKWRKYLKKIDGDDGDCIYYRPPFGCAGKWGYKNELHGDQWFLCGSTKNYHNQIQVFLVKVLVPITSTITTCQTISDYSRDYASTVHFDSDSDSDEDLVHNHTDNELRTYSWKNLHIM
jgi:hypothetical protein